MTLSTRWRSMTDEELAELQEAAIERRSLRLAEHRHEYPNPQAAETSYSGAIYWAFTVLRQDNPLFLCLGVILGGWVILRSALGAFGISIM